MLSHLYQYLWKLNFYKCIASSNGAYTLSFSRLQACLITMCEKAFFWLEQISDVEIRRLDQRGTEEPDHAGLVGHGNGWLITSLFNLANQRKDFLLYMHYPFVLFCKLPIFPCFLLSCLSHSFWIVDFFLNVGSTSSLLYVSTIPFIIFLKDLVNSSLLVNYIFANKIHLCKLVKEYFQPIICFDMFANYSIWYLVKNY